MNVLERLRSPRVAAIVAAVVLLAVLVLWDSSTRSGGGTTTAAATATAAPEPTTTAAESSEQAAAIAAKAVADSTAAVQQGGPEGQAARDAVFTGAALTAANAENRLLSVQTPEQKEAAVLSDAAPVVLAVSEGSGYPRAMLVQTTRRQSGFPVLTLLVSPDAQTGYKVAASATMLSGAYAGFTPVKYGATFVADAAEGLGASGEAVFTEYARTLGYPVPQSGDLPFTSDTFATSVRDAAASQAASLGSTVTYTQGHAYQGLLGGFGLAENNGSLVFVTLDRTDTLKENSANAINVPAVFRELSGKSSIDSEGEQKSLEFLVFTVPPEGKATLVGARVQPYAATGQ